MTGGTPRRSRLGRRERGGHPSGVTPNSKACWPPQRCPRRAVTIGAVRTHQLTHLTDQLVAELALAAVAGHTAGNRGPHIAVHRLAVHQRRRSTERYPSPRSHHRRTSRISCTWTSLKLIATCLCRCRSGGDSNLSSVAAGACSRVVPSLAKRWSHAAGETHLTVVPCGWRYSPHGGPMLLAGDTRRRAPRAWRLRCCRAPELLAPTRTPGLRRNDVEALFKRWVPWSRRSGRLAASWSLW